MAAVLLAHLGRPEDLEDRLQEVAMIFVEREAELRDRTALRPWLRRVALNVVRTAARGDLARRRRPRPADRDEPEPADLRPAAEERRDEAAQLVRKALLHAGMLPEELREPLLLKTLDGLSQREIAQVLEVPETTIETRLARARRWLRERIDAGIPAPGERR